MGLHATHQSHAGIVRASQQVAERRRLYGDDHVAAGFDRAVTEAVNGYRADLAERWSNLRALAGLAHEQRVAARTVYAVSLAGAARDCGLVPHPESGWPDCNCERVQRRQRNAAAVAWFEYRHQWTGSDTGRYHVTAWDMAR